MKSVALSFVFSRATIWTPAPFSVFSTSFGEAFAVGGSVVGDGDLLRLQLVRHVRGHRGTLLVVAADGAEHDLEALFGQLRVRRRAGDHRQAGLVVDGRRGDRHARVQVADHAGDLGVDELLARSVGPIFAIGLVVLAHHLELDRPCRRS